MNNDKMWGGGCGRKGNSIFSTMFINTEGGTVGDGLYRRTATDIEPVTCKSVTVNH